MGLTYDRNKTFAVDPRLNAVKLKRRTRGRPKNIGGALAKEPEDGEHAQPRAEDEAGGDEAGGDEAGGERPEEAGEAHRTEERGQGQAMIQRSVWSSYPTFIGNIEINDVGEVQPSTSGSSREHQHADVEEFDMVLE